MGSICVIILGYKNQWVLNFKVLQQKRHFGIVKVVQYHRHVCQCNTLQNLNFLKLDDIDNS